MGEFLDFVKKYGPVMEDVNEFDWLRSEGVVKDEEERTNPFDHYFKINTVAFLELVYFVCHGRC